MTDATRAIVDYAEQDNAKEMREFETTILELFDAANDPRSFNKHNQNKKFRVINSINIYNNNFLFLFWWNGI